MQQNTIPSPHQHTLHPRPRHRTQHTLIQLLILQRRRRRRSQLQITTSRQTTNTQRRQQDIPHTSNQQSIPKQFNLIKRLLQPLRPLTQHYPKRPTTPYLRRHPSQQFIHTSQRTTLHSRKQRPRPPTKSQRNLRLQASLQPTITQKLIILSKHLTHLPRQRSQRRQRPSRPRRLLRRQPILRPILTATIK